jgi:hypothetical protein
MRVVRCIRKALSSASIMNMYWVYDLPNWLFGVLTIGVTVAIGVDGLVCDSEMGAACSRRQTFA